MYSMYDVSKRFIHQCIDSFTNYKRSFLKVLNLSVTGMMRRETCGSKCKLFIIKYGQYRQGRAVANRYGMGKTQE